MGVCWYLIFLKVGENILCVCFLNIIYMYILEIHPLTSTVPRPIKNISFPIEDYILLQIIWMVVLVFSTERDN
jgi:hypothetical protein